MVTSRFPNFRPSVPKAEGLLPNAHRWDQLLARQLAAYEKLDTKPGTTGSSTKGRRRRQPPLALIVRDLAGWCSPTPGTWAY